VRETDKITERKIFKEKGRMKLGEENEEKR